MGGKRNRGILAAAVGLVAAVAIPFVAPAVATAVFGSAAVAAAPILTATATGAALGAGAGALSGSITGDMGRGALIGGAGGAFGGFVQGGGLDAASNALFGPGTATTVSYTAPPVPLGAEAATLAPIEGATYFGPTTIDGGVGVGVGSGLGAGGVQPGLAAGGMSYEALTAPISAAAAPGGAGAGIGSAAAAAPVTTAGVSSGAAPGFAATAAKPAVAGTVGERFMAGLTGGGPSILSAEGAGRAVGGLLTPSGIASVGQLAMTMYNRPPQDLTPEERNYVNETAELASTNRAVFEERVSAARRLLQQGTPNPEQAYAQARLGVERGFRERGFRSEADERRAAIEGTRLGSAAVSGENVRAAGVTQAGLSSMPTTAPAGPAALALPAYRDVERRQREYEADLARGVGGLAGALGGNRSKSSLFA